MKSITTETAHNPDGTITYGGTGYGVEPCATCGGQLLPGEARRVTPGVWMPSHEDCPAVVTRPPLPPATRVQTNRCRICGDDDHLEGLCLI